MNQLLKSILVLTIVFSGFRNVDGGGMTRATYIFMNVERTDFPSQSMEVCANFYPNPDTRPGALPMARNLETAIPLRLAYNSELFGQSHPSDASLSGEIIHTFLHDSATEEKDINDRIIALQENNASAVLFVTTPDKTHASYYDPRVNSSIAAIPIYYINEKTQDKFSKFVGNRSKTYNLRFYIPNDPPFDIAMVLILLIAMICITIGGAWSGRKHYDLYLQEMGKRTTVTSSESSVRPRAALNRGDEPADEATANADNKSTVNSAWSETSGSSNTNEMAASPFSWITLVVFLVIIVGFLLLLYFLYSVVVWLVIVIFVIASSCAMCECLWYFVEKLPCGNCTFTLTPLADFLSRICRCCQWKLFRVTIEYRHAALYIFCISVAIIWAVYRHWSYSFILHDVLATFFSIVTIRNLRIPNLMWVTCLLSLLLVYDLFMVFITPYMTPSGCSVMIDVATGGGCSKNMDVPAQATYNFPPSDVPAKEELPIVIRVPRFNDPVWSCFQMEYDLQYPPVILGLGDIILPGILIGYNAAFSLASRAPYRLYYTVGVIGYFFGMIATFMALLLSKAAQPALIYLVPFTLVPTHLAALIRKDWKKMWKGQFPLIEESCPILKQESTEQQPIAQADHTAPVDGRTSILHGTDHVAPA